MIFDCCMFSDEYELLLLRLMTLKDIVDKFDHNVVLPNGDVYICCMDYGLKHKIGNLFTTHYDHLDRDSLRSLMKKGNIICRYCELSEIVTNE